MEFPSFYEWQKLDFFHRTGTLKNAGTYINTQPFFDFKGYHKKVALSIDYGCNLVVRSRRLR